MGERTSLMSHNLRASMSTAANEGANEFPQKQFTIIFIIDQRWAAGQALLTPVLLTD